MVAIAGVVQEIKEFGGLAVTLVISDSGVLGIRNNMQESIYAVKPDLFIVTHVITGEDRYPGGKTTYCTTEERNQRIKI